jgi:hypothetical protein
MKEEAIERVVDAVEQMVHSDGLRGYDRLRRALSDFAKAIEASMACTLLTRETETMGGYAAEQREPHNNPGLPKHAFYGKTGEPCQYLTGSTFDRTLSPCGASEESHR